MTYQTIVSVEQLHAQLSDENWRVFDCRFVLGDPAAGPALYRQGHIPGARFADLDKDLASAVTPSSGRHPLPDPLVFSEKLRNWGVSGTSQVVCYDDLGGAFAARMWWLLKWLGHECVAVLDGGIGAWQASGLALETDVPREAAGTFSPIADDSLWVDTSHLLERLMHPAMTLLDARTRARYTARDLATDPVPGHVPGALCFPFSDNLTQDGRLRCVDALRARFEPVLAARGRGEVVAMCGSGVTACHNLLAMRVAGYEMARLYVGSWSEWIKDPSRPVATGDGDTERA